MDDTRPEIAEKMRKMVQEKTPAERLKMGCSMHAASKYLVARATPPAYSGIEARQHIFASFYGTDFDPETRQKIIDHLGKPAIFPTDIDFAFSHIPAEEKLQPWWRLWNPLIHARRLRANPEQSRLLCTLNKKEDLRTWRNIKYCTELALNFVKHGERILGRTAEIRSSPDPDGIIDDLFAELRTIPYLLFKGFNNITYFQKDSLDFQATFEEKEYWIESTYIHGSDFKTQELFYTETIHPIYKIQPDKLVDRLSNVYQQKEKQVLKHGGTPENSLIFIVTDLEESYAPWLDHIAGAHPLRQLILDWKISTVIFGAGSVYEPWNRTFAKLRPFDWKAFAAEFLLYNS